MLFKKQRRRPTSSASTKLSFEVLESRQLLAGLDGSEIIGLPSDMISNAYVFIGDHSPSNSEKWNMTVGDRTHMAPDFGVVQRDYRGFKKGESYPVTVQHAGSIYPSGQEDYDYRAWIDRYANPTWTSSSLVPFGHEFFVTDPQQLFQRQYWSNPGDPDPTAGKSAMVRFPAIDLDIDSDANGTLDRSLAEDVAEADQTKGLFFPVYSGDLDADGIPDNFDFNGVAGLSFTPMALSLSSNVAFAYATQITLTFNYDAAGLTIGDTGLFRIWTKDASQARTSSDLISSGQPIDAWSIGLTPGSSITLYLEAVNPTRRTVNFDPISVTADLTGGTIPGPQAWYGVLTDKVHASGIEVNMDAKTISHNTADGILDKTSQNTVGAFLPVNDDDDDYDASNSADHTQSGAIQGENDLLPIVLRKVKRGGTFRLEIPNHLRVWKNANRTDQVTATTDINASVETTLYVEGISKATGDLKVNWTLGGQSINNGDQLKVTAFQWSGPLNVPGYSIYNYKAEGALGTSKWVTPVHGSEMNSGSGSPNDPTSHEIDILWGEGAVVGKAVYEVNDKYKWDLEVNVVRIILGQTNSLSYNNPPVQQNNALINSVAAGGGEAVEAQLEIERIEGPLVGGISRGVRFIEVGFVQNGRWTEKFGEFDQLPTAAGGMGRRRVSSLMDGNYHIDYLTNPLSTSPWYDSPDASGVNGGVGVLRNLGDIQVNATLFDMSDRPTQLGSDVMTLVEGRNTDQIDRISIIFDFNLYFTVRTTQSVNGSEHRYTQRASAHWTFNGSGTFDIAGNWTASANAGNSGSSSFSEITTGAVVPVTTGTPCNDLTATGQTWSTEDQ